MSFHYRGWKVGSQEIPEVTGKFGLGVQNEAEQRLIEFCQENTLVIANTLFQQHEKALHMDITRWPIQNPIDSILCSQRCRSSIQSAKTRAGADCDSDHEPLIAKFSSVILSCTTLCSPMDCSMPGLPVYHQLPEFTETNVHWVGDAIQPSHPLLSPSPPTFNISQHRVFSDESVLHIRWPKYWSFSFSINPSNEYSGLIAFRMGCLDLLAVQGTLKGLLQHHSSKASILRCSAFFIVKLSHPFMTTGKTIALTRCTFVGKVMSLLFNMLSRLVIIFFQGASVF